MEKPTSANDLSPLDQIRLAEAEITRKVAAAREASEHGAANVRVQAAGIKKQAEETGEREGQIRYKEIIAKAEEQASLITAQAHTDAESLCRSGETHMQQAVAEALRIILGVKNSGGAHES